MTHYCETKLGEHDINLVCMDQSGCKLVFAEEELKKFLPEKLLDLYYRVKQRKEIEAAGVENLEECPFCDYKVIIENPDEKLFRCARDECGVVSCRACKKPVCSHSLLLRMPVADFCASGSFAQGLRRYTALAYPCISF